MPVDREGNRPQLMRQGQSGSVVCVRALIAVVLRQPCRLGDALLKFFVCLAQVMEQARQLCLTLALEMRGELSRPASHPQEMLNERLIRVGVVCHLFS